MPLTKRAPSAEAAGCTHFLAIHCNAGGGAGVEAFYRDNGDQEFANAVCNAAVEATGLKNRGVKPEYNSQYKHLAVLSFKGRAALLEIGYLDNKQDAKALVNRDVRIAFANKLADMFM
jgi:N-acetylmuramoyl-L-alanine amidase